MSSSKTILGSASWLNDVSTHRNRSGSLFLQSKARESRLAENPGLLVCRRYLSDAQL